MGGTARTAADPASLWEKPAMKAPPGESYHLEHPPNQSLEGYVGATVAIGVAALFCALKLSSRLSKKQRLQVEDWLMLLALGHYAGFIAMLVEIYQYPGNLAHQWNIRLGAIPDFLHKLYIASVTYCFAVLFLKAAILLQWIRLFVPTGARNLFFWIAQALLWTNCMFYFACALAQIFRCNPIEAAWNIFLEGEVHCVDFDAIVITTSVVSAVSDLFILVLPQPVIWKLQMSTDRKIGVSVVFAAGLLSCTGAAARTYYSVELMNSEDKTFWTGTIGACAMVEISCGFLVLCLPSIPSVVRNSSLAKRLPPMFRFIKPGSSSPGERASRPTRPTAGGSREAGEPHLLHDMSRESSGTRSYGMRSPNDLLADPKDKRAVTRMIGAERSSDPIAQMGPGDYQWQQGWSNLHNPRDYRG